MGTAGNERSPETWSLMRRIVSLVLQLRAERRAATRRTGHQLSADLRLSPLALRNLDFPSSIAEGFSSCLRLILAYAFGTR
jgi:hypothetical protein